MVIHQLPETLINQIAAGEVIERPASVIKELVENALDAGATQIHIATASGGKSLMRVSDDGGGMSPENLSLAIGRHCTSKISTSLDDIGTLGFRGEALASIGSIARLRIQSRPPDADSGYEIEVAGGKPSDPKPSAVNTGTVVEVRDIFFATPARLKFLKSDRAEAGAITETVKRIAIAFPAVRFVLSGTDRTTLDYPSTGSDQLRRIGQVLGPDFEQNTIGIDAVREGVSLTGFVGIPTFHRGNSLRQFIYVNGRPVQDKLLSAALRAAYGDTIPRGRYPVAALFVAIDPTLVDVNVHPAKADVRFRDPGLLRGLIIGAIREALTQNGSRASTLGTQDLAAAFRSEPASTSRSNSGANGSAYYAPNASDESYRLEESPFRPFAHNAPEPNAELQNTLNEVGIEPSSRADDRLPEALETDDFPLGAARAQLHENYIVAQTEDGLVIVDQHAAHERLVYEKLKQTLHAKDVPAQSLLIPEIVDLPEEDCDRLMPHAEALMKLGLGIERFGPGAIAIRETPSILGEIDGAGLVRQLVEEIAEWGDASALADRIDYVAATMACHGSVRSGRRLNAEEMNGLLRQMESTPGSGQCNHGRPTYIELKLKDIERLFGRR